MKAVIIGNPQRTERYAPDLEVFRQTQKVFFPLGTPVEEILRENSDADVLLVDAIASVPAELIAGMPELRMIHSEGVAVNGIDLEAARKRGVYVCNNKGMNAGAVAEQAILLMLGLLRDVAFGNAAVLAGKQIQVKESRMVEGITDLADCRVGLVGFGDIAMAVADRLRAFGTEVVYYNHHRRPQEVEQAHGVRYLPLEELLSTSDLVSLHVAVTEQTRGMVDDDFLGKMKRSAYLINTARGDLVNNEALARALESGSIAGVGLDTIAPEPTTIDNPLLNLQPAGGVRLLYSPHIGGITTGSFLRGYRMMWEDVGRIARGERPDHVVNGL